jgi:pre-rRNA-processing protein TSR3
MLAWPPTICVVHRRENPSKCSIRSLRGRTGFLFSTYPDPLEYPLDGYVRLGFDGPLLSAADRDCGLLVLDATWRLSKRMETVYRDVPVRSLPVCQTAYPRVSKANDDPHGGLATIEAIYVAYRLLGRDTAGLLDDYYWAEAFMQKNGFES